MERSQRLREEERWLLFLRPGTHTCTHTHTVVHPLKHALAFSHSQIVGTISRVMVTSLSVLPVQREGWLSDNETVRRFMRRPNTVVDGFFMSQMDMMMGYLAGLAGGCEWIAFVCLCACLSVCG